MARQCWKRATVGQSGTERAVGKDTVFRIGSVTKQFAAAALLKWRKKAAVDEDKRRKYYPSYPRAADITWRRCFTTPQACTVTRDSVILDREAA